MENVNPCLAGRQVKTKNDTAQSPGPSWSKILVSLTVLVVLVIGYGFLAKANNWWPHEVTNPTPSTSDVDITDWQTYRNGKYGFEFKYPTEYSPKMNFNREWRELDRIETILVSFSVVLECENIYEDIYEICPFFEVRVLEKDQFLNLDELSQVGFKSQYNRTTFQGYPATFQTSAPARTFFEKYYIWKDTQPYSIIVGTFDMGEVGVWNQKNAIVGAIFKSFQFTK